MYCDNVVIPELNFMPLGYALLVIFFFMLIDATVLKFWFTLLIRAKDVLRSISIGARGYILFRLVRRAHPTPTVFIAKLWFLV